MRIAILSKGKNVYSTKRLMEAAKQNGHKAKVLDPFEFTLQIAGEGRKIYYRSRGIDDRYDVLIPRLSNATAEYGLEIVEHFEMLSIPVINGSMAISKSRNKFKCLRILSQHGIPVPVSFITGSVEFLDNHIKRVGSYPLIIKPFYGTQGKRIMLLDTPKSAESTIDALCDMHQNYVIQHFFSGACGSDIRVLVVGGRVIGSIRRIAQRGEFRSNIHLGAIGVEFNLPKEYEEIALKAVKDIGLQLAGVDMIETDEGPLVLEVNPSPGFEGFEAATKRDIAGGIIRYAEQVAEKIDEGMRG